ncbi:C40 family peptidase [Terrabacter sp. NPDC080008]|uniref:C40 family peptidase n=1 Tax=Terrabacter sp. NPDC080008 TaxID=3155176 RepID=UPI00344F78BE
MSSPVAAVVTATHLVRVPVTTVWSGPDSPRPVDEPMVREIPDATAWLAALDAHPDDDETGDGRLGLHGRVETQLLDGEPVVVLGTDASGAWAQVVAPWQLSPKDERGYPGWVPAAHLAPLTEGRTVTPPSATLGTSAQDGTHPAVAEARRHVGLPYLWCGITPLGFDCSGLVLHTWRLLGVLVTRDAYAQAEFATPVPLDAVEPGDLYFFARPGRAIHHVGIVVRPGRMVHASETGGVLVEEDLPAERVATLVAAGRLPMP